MVGEVKEMRGINVYCVYFEMRETTFPWPLVIFQMGLRSFSGFEVKAVVLNEAEGLSSKTIKF